MTAMTKSMKSGGMQQPASNVILKNSLKNTASIEKCMLQRVLSIIRKNHIDQQLFNMLRYEIFRIDVDRTMLMPSKTFKDIYRNLNIKMPLEDFNYFIEFMKLNAKPYREEYDEKMYLNKLTMGTPYQIKNKQFDDEITYDNYRTTTLYRREKV